MKTETEIVLEDIKQKRLELFKLREKLKTIKDEEIESLLKPFLNKFYLEIKDDNVNVHWKYMYVNTLKNNELFCLSITLINQNYSNLNNNDEFSNYYLLNENMNKLKEISSDNFIKILDDFCITIKDIIK